MIFALGYESQSHLITPAALAVTEPPAPSIAEQRWIFHTNGVALVDMKGQSPATWYRDQLLISPNLFFGMGGALIPALDPRSAGNPGPRLGSMDAGGELVPLRHP